MEMQKVPEAGYDIIGLPITGIQRRLTLEESGLSHLSFGQASRKQRKS